MSTSLSYNIYNQCDNSYLYGSGQIPNDAFTGSPQSGSMALTIDVSRVPNFYMTEGSLPLSVSLTWQKHPFCRDLMSGYHMAEFPMSSNLGNFIVRKAQNGHHFGYCAQVSGQISGPFSFSGSAGFGYLYDDVTLTRTIERVIK